MLHGHTCPVRLLAFFYDYDMLCSGTKNTVITLPHAINNKQATHDDNHDDDDAFLDYHD